MATEYNQIELELYMIRHGQTFSNIGANMDEFSHIDKHDTLLTPTGTHMAELLGERFKDYPFDCIYTSGLRRAMHTASEIVKKQPENGCHNLVIHPLLSETGGEEDVYPGLTFAQIKELHPCALLADGFSENDRMLSFTKGWSDEMQLERAKKLVDHIRARHKNGEKVAIVAHAAFNTFLFHHILGLDPENLIFDPHFLNTGVTKFIFFKEGTGKFADIQLVYHNDLSHLYAEFPKYGLDPCYA